MAAVKKKILMQTLGIGSLDEKGKPGYKLTSYSYNGKIIAQDTEYVSFPLIELFDPDEIFILGTIQSDWYGLFHRISENKDDEELRILEMQENEGINTPKERLKELQKELTDIFMRSVSRSPYQGKTLHIILTRYGINQNELEDNYVILSEIEQSLSNKYTYEVAMDITHSFRSLPIYNLVILNYISSISDIEINITNVYYGNFDAKKDNNDIAPITDLGELLRVQKLTNAIQEFKNSGNTDTLKALIPDSMSDLRGALDEFGWATQINSFTRIDKGLTNLLEITGRPSQSEGKYVDLNRMIYSVLSSRFVGAENSKDSLKIYRDMSDADKRLRVTLWYQNQNRYGTAVATACEALRSFLVELYIRDILNAPIDDKKLKDENLRRNAVSRLGQIKYEEAAKYTENKELVTFFKKLGTQYGKAKVIRDRFAHNLQNEDKGLRATKAERDEIDKFINQIITLKKYIATDRQEIANVYAFRWKKGKSKSDRGSVLLVYEKKKAIDYAKYEEKDDVYLLEEDVITAMFKNKNKLENGLLVAQILGNSGIENVKICLIGMDDASVQAYTIALKNMGYSQVCDQEKKMLPDPNIVIDKSYYEQKGFSDEFDSFKNMQCIRYSE